MARWRGVHRPRLFSEIQKFRKFKKEFDTSGKSRAYSHRRKNFKACAGKSVAGFLNRTATARWPAWIIWHVGQITGTRISKPAPGNWQRVFSLAGARERAGMRRGLSTFVRRPRSDDLRSRWRDDLRSRWG
jgi:hypothetical protein